MTSTSADPIREAFRRVFPGVMVAMFLAAADQTILASALPTIASRLGGFEDLSWVVIAYLLAASVAAPLYGHLGDRFGRRRMLLSALAVFTLASLGCALAPSLIALIVGRAVQGLGGGGLMTLSQSLLGENVPPRERGRFQGYFAAVFALASTSGPVLGAYLTEHLSWRSVFAINLPLGVAAIVLALRIPNSPPARQSGYQPDFVGIALFCAATVGLLYALSSAGHRLPFDAWPLYALIAIVVVGFAGLYAWERRQAHPILPLHLLRMPAIVRSDLVVMCFAATLFATVLYLPLYLQIGRGLGIGKSGTLLLPITLAIVVGATTAGRMVSRTGKVVVFPIVGLSLATLALVALAASLTIAPIAAIVVLNALIGIGLGMVMPPIQVTVQHTAGRESLGSAIGTLSLSRSIGGAIGVAIVGAIVFLSIGYANPELAKTIQRVMEAGPEYLSRLAAGDRAAISMELDHTFRIVFLTIAAISGSGVLIARTIPQPEL
jgi:EmrB/QacA subfamily drug resistance transporter